MAEIVHKKFEGKPIDRAMQNFLSICMDGKKASLDVIAENEEHALERVVAFNKFFAEHKHLAELDKIMESMITHLGNHPHIIETASIKDVLKICFIGYDNRTIQIENYDITPDTASEICQSYGVSCIANYKHNIFDATDAASWRKKNIPLVGERMVIYAKEGEKAPELFNDISNYLGKIVAVRKKYSQYASHLYMFNNEQRTFEKSAVAFEKGYTMPFKEKHFGADIWFRTQTQEVNDKDFINLGLKKGDKVTILCKPKNVADEFYRGLDAFLYEKEPLFKRINE